jgi:hypothetical protein
MANCPKGGHEGRWVERCTARGTATTGGSVFQSAYDQGSHRGFRPAERELDNAADFRNWRMPQVDNGTGSPPASAVR